MPSRSIFGTIFLAILLASCGIPIAQFAIADEVEVRKAPATVTFSNLTPEADKYLWEFGDRKTSTEKSPSHTYYLSGKYHVILHTIKGGKKSMTQKDIIIQAPDKCLINMETSEGNMIIELYDGTSGHRDNFIKLAETGYYENTLFHRVIDGFMIQGGDPDSKGSKPGERLGSGGPGYQIPAEFDASFAHVKGALAAARQGDAANPEKKSSGSQFYIVHGSPVQSGMLEQMEMRKGITYTDDQKADYDEKGGTPFLDNEYTVFGRVIEGLDIIDKIASTATDSSDRPREDIKILSVTQLK